MAQTKKITGLKVVSVFFYQGAKIYIRHKSHHFEFLIILKKWPWRQPDLFTHYFEFSPPVNTKRELLREEEIRCVLAIQDAARETVKEIHDQRSFKEEIKQLYQDGLKSIRISFAKFKRKIRSSKAKRLPRQEGQASQEAAAAVNV